ncbi:RNA-directed DNA polymerase, eukaryota, reverse transcriptase zinc-binding domain protein [Tanacetum coccineum]
MVFMGFECRWRGWIRGCLKSAKASVLINGSPSYEFSLHRGLRQGDPLSPFLFILVMEALHVAVEDVIDVGLYHGVQVRSLPISRLLFADDFFLGEWSRSNIIGIASLLQCFHSVSGLKINLQKSSLYGSLGVYYLSLFPMPKQINKRLESLRENFFWGCTDEIKKIPWIFWNSVLASKLKGGLGIGSLEALNFSLFKKWRWRFFNSPQALWVKFISEIHGSYDTVGYVFFHQCGGSGTWSRIVGAINDIHDKGIIPHSSIKFQVKDDSATRFWRDTWLGDIPLERQYPRLFCLEANKDCLVRDSECENYRRSRCLAMEFNRLEYLHDRIPTRWNLSRKGLEVPSLLCPLCNISPETSSHLFWTCNLATSVWRLIFKWIDLPLPNSDNLNDVYGWLDHARLNSASKNIMHSIFGVVVWTLWQFRNNNIFGDKKMLQKDLLDQIVDASFLWYSSRNRNCKVYDVTPFMKDHPGGDEVLLAATGEDATTAFEDVGHSDDAWDMMHKYYIGEVDKETVPRKRVFVPPNDRAYNPDKTPEFVIKILQFLVPLMILGLGFAIRSYTKEKSA